MPIPRKWVSLKRQIFEFEGQPKEFGQLDGSVNKVTNLINGHLIDFKKHNSPIFVKLCLHQFKSIQHVTDFLEMIVFSTDANTVKHFFCKILSLNNNFKGIIQFQFQADTFSTETDNL